MQPAARARRFVVVTLLACLAGSVACASTLALKVKVIDLPAPGTGYSSPTSLAAGPSGSVWVSEEGTYDAIAQISPGGHVTQFPLATGDVPGGFAVSADGNLWYVTGTVGFFSPLGSAV
jgi:streptogramin lyase